MYRFLRAEMVRSNITISKLADQIGVAEKTLRNKINGETDFTWQEALRVRKIVAPKMGLEELFQVDGEEVRGI